MQVFNYGSIPLGAIAAGFIASHLGVRAALWTMLTGSALATLVLLTGPLRHLRDRIQRRPAFITGFLGQTGLTLEPELP